MMTPTRRAVTSLAIALPMAAAAQPAADILAAGAAKTAVEGLLASVARTWTAQFGTVGALRDQMLSGGQASVVLLSDDAIARLDAASLILPDSRRRIGRIGVALATRAGAPLPRIDTPEALRDALLATPSFAYADPDRGATAGAHVARILDRLGIAAAMHTKSRLVPFGVDGVTLAATGEVALAASQASEIIGRADVAMVGLLPDALQLWTGYSLALTQACPPMDREALLSLFTSPAAQAAFAATGFVA